MGREPEERADWLKRVLKRLADLRAEAERRRAATDNAPAEDWWCAPINAAGDALAAALEARDREHDAAFGRMVGEIEARDRIIAELEAGLRAIADGVRPYASARRLARDLLAGRAVADGHLHLDDLEAPR